MISKEHRKHGKTVRANFGYFGRVEIAIMGTPCGEIKKMAQHIIEKLQDYRIAYIDADHNTEEENVPIHLKSGAGFVYTDKIKFHRFEFGGQLTVYERNKLFNEFDLVLVNGNHFEADMQIIVIDDRKPLEKKLEKIKKPIAILSDNDHQPIPGYLEKYLDKTAGIQPLPTVKQLEDVTGLIRKELRSRIPKLNGLVLAGGKSERMGKDKGLINYHGMPQREYVYRLLESFTEQSFMSCRPDQVDDFGDNFSVIPDSIDGLGPFGAILSAFREFPNHAWIVVACDIPLIDEHAITELISGRNPSKIATAFYNAETKFPDPLLTIWEPKAYPQLLHFLSLGYSCPRKTLINSNTEILHPSNPNILLNANSPDDYKKVKQLLEESR